MFVPVNVSGDCATAQVPNNPPSGSSRPPTPIKSVYPVMTGAGDDSPFIRPRSPSALVQPRRPPLQPFRGDGSVGFHYLSINSIPLYTDLYVIDARRHPYPHPSTPSNPMDR
jgi:hypothetical protein